MLTSFRSHAPNFLVCGLLSIGIRDLGARKAEENVVDLTYELGWIYLVAYG